MARGSSGVAAKLRENGVPVALGVLGELVVPTELPIAQELRTELQANRHLIVEELWAESNVALLASMPISACGSAMSRDKYQELRSFIDWSGKAVLVGFNGAGTIVRVTPPNDVLPAGAVTLLLANGEREDYDTRMLRYGDGEPVADVAWAIAEPSANDSVSPSANELPTGSFLWVATDLDSFEDTDSRLGVEVECDAVYRLLDAPYYAWLRRHMESAQKAHKAGAIDKATFDTMRERFNVIHTWAVEHIGEDNLREAIRTTDVATYAAPSAQTYATYRKAQNDAWDAQERQRAASGAEDARTPYAREFDRQMAEKGYVVIDSSVVGERVVVTRDESVNVPKEWAGLVPFTMDEIGQLKNAGPDMTKQVYEVKRRFGGAVLPFDEQLARRVWPEDYPTSAVPQAG